MTLLKAGAHFGHKLSKRHPKMEPYIFMNKGGFHIINLEQTQTKLQEALDFTKKVVSNGGTILFLGTKKQAQPIVEKYAKACNMPYVTERWLGGTFTNFGEISRMIRKLTDLKKRKALGQLEKYTKKEKLEFDKQIEKLDRMVGGVENMSKIPEAIFVIDIKNEKTAVSESIKKDISIVAMVDTNVNPELINYPVPINDDAVKSIEIVTSLMAQAVIDGQAERAKSMPAVEKPAVAKK